MMVEDIKKDLYNLLKEIQENTAKQVEDIKEEVQKSLKELQENTTKQVVACVLTQFQRLLCCTVAC